MMFKMLHSKLHRARVTRAELHYNGSLGIDRDLIEMAGMMPGQQIDVLNVNNGARFTTYILEEPRGSKTIGVYGAAAHLAKPGDLVIVIAYALMDEREAKKFRPVVLVLDEKNNVVENA
ncbi:MAG: aspartate 1-decarboxylase [Pseudomonadota bacterium]|nr:aspartate 1-decarboxylase [Pseudomonadota bacterium]MDE3037430.1 aspartate 1-decarboxylase [Pseudomonadota bacterium]